MHITVDYKSTSYATVEGLYHVPENAKAELINGEIVALSPTGGLPGYAAMKITVSLFAYVEKTGQGHATGDNVGFIVNLPNRKSFSPDAAFHKHPLTMKFIEGAPSFAVEVRSEGDYGAKAEKAINEKRADYFAAGTLVVWDVDLLNNNVVSVYRVDHPHKPTIYYRGEFAEAEPAVSGWTMPVDELFIR